MNKLSLFFFLLSFFLKVSYSQSLYGFEHYTDHDGLNSNFVTSIMQDHSGYLWFGTINGLTRYNGYELINFEVVPNDTNFLQIPQVHSLYEDSENNIWIGATGGVTRYSPMQKNFKFYRFSDIQTEYATLDVTDILETENGDILLTVRDDNFNPTKNGLYIIPHSTDHLEVLQFNNVDSSNALFQIRNINGKYYAAGEKGFAWIDIKNKTLHWLVSVDRWIVSILVDGDQVWLGAKEFGLIKYDLINNTSDSYFFYDKVKNQNELNFFNIWDMISGSDGKILMASTKGLLSFNTRSGKIDISKVDANDPKAMHSSFLIDIFQDLSGSIWIASRNAGISKYNTVQDNFSALISKSDDVSGNSQGWVNTIFEYNKDELWFYTGSTWLSIYNRKSKKLRHITLPDGFFLNTIISNSENEIMVAGYGGCYILNPHNWQFRKKIFPSSFDNTSINQIKEINPGIYWCATQNGLYIIDDVNFTATKADFVKLGIGSPASNQLRSIITDKNGNAWLNSDDGLFYYDQRSKIFSRIGNAREPGKSLLNQDVNAIYLDKDGYLWCGSWLGALQKYDPHTAVFTSYGQTHGFNSHSVQAILGDEENGAIWVSSFEGISRFDINSELFSNFGLSDGVHAKQFADGAALKTTDGLFIFGGQNGATVFRPSQTQKNVTKPKITFSDFKLFNQSVAIGPDSPLQKPLEETKKIVLQYDENDIAFDYFAAHYVDPQNNQYAYMLENYEDDWRYVGNQRTAIYPNLPPGEYVFHLKASNNNKVWNEDGVKIAVVINPPLWATWWAYTCYVFLTLGLLFSLRRLELKRRQEKEESKRKSRELEEARQLQLSMLPKELPQLPYLDITVYMQTATEVGGDYYDFHVSMDGTLTVVIGDATGHGMKAGTMVTTAKSLFKSYGSNPDILFSFDEFSRCIREMNFGRISMCLTMVKIQNSTLQISSAGMPPAYIYRTKTKDVEEYQFEAMPLGAMDKFPYQLQETQLYPGDTVLLLSDGLPELENKNGQMYGYSNISDSFKSVAEKSPDDIISYLKNEVTSWVNNAAPDDDVTFVVIKVK